MDPSSSSLFDASLAWHVQEKLTVEEDPTREEEVEVEVTTNSPTVHQASSGWTVKEDENDIATTTTTTTTDATATSEEFVAKAVTMTSTLSASASATSQRGMLLCDAGYGLPREGRPRKEKVLAMARQLVNFLTWQREASSTDVVGEFGTTPPVARVQVVACANPSVRQALEERTLHLLGTKELPHHVSFSCQSLEDACGILPGRCQSQALLPLPIVYLSPDAPESLDPTQVPPRVVIVGLLIDRRVQPHRSHERAKQLVLQPMAMEAAATTEPSSSPTTTTATTVVVVAKRWPLEECFQDISANEPLNVDCIMEGMQQWWWNTDDNDATSTAPRMCKENFVQAASQALQHHAERHPRRPIHLPATATTTAASVSS